MPVTFQLSPEPFQLAFVVLLNITELKMYAVALLYPLTGDSFGFVDWTPFDLRLAQNCVLIVVRRRNGGIPPCNHKRDQIQMSEKTGYGFCLLS